MWPCRFHSSSNKDKEDLEYICFKSLLALGLIYRVVILPTSAWHRLHSMWMSCSAVCGDGQRGGDCSQGSSPQQPTKCCCGGDHLLSEKERRDTEIHSLSPKPCIIIICSPKLWYHPISKGQLKYSYILFICNWIDVIRFDLPTGLTFVFSNVSPLIIKSFTNVYRQL